MVLYKQQIIDFHEVVWNFYKDNARTMPWREDTRAYFILVSELMLQQTQVERVIPKFNAFVQRFPDMSALAHASLAEVLQLWSGLGYNRRAKFLWQAAQAVQEEFAGEIPKTLDDLQKLPGVGPNTAGAIAVYVYNQPMVFIETNVRTVLFHHFFADHTGQVSDKQLRDIAKQVLDVEQPREWYWALMDYGTYLKKTAGGRLTQSTHYKKQAPLKGSKREMRGRILKVLSQAPLSEEQLREHVAADERYESALAALLAEEMVVKDDDKLSLHGGVS